NVCQQVPFKDGGLSLFCIKVCVDRRMPVVGWSIDIEIGEEWVKVRHTKGQKQLCIGTTKEEFSFEWELEMVFACDMEELKSVSLCISKLNFTDDASPATKQLLGDTFAPHLKHGNH